MTGELCNFRKDGNWNIIEGPDEQGRIRVQCIVCGALAPPANAAPKVLTDKHRIKVRCKPDRNAQRLATSTVDAKARGKSCPESCLLRAKHHQASLIAELNSVIIKAKDPELKAVATAMLAEATKGQLPEERFKTALALAVKQAVREGRESS